MVSFDNKCKNNLRVKLRFPPKLSHTYRSKTKKAKGAINVCHCHIPGELLVVDELRPRKVNLYKNPLGTRNRVILRACLGLIQIKCRTRHWSWLGRLTVLLLAVSTYVSLMPLYQILEVSYFKFFLQFGWRLGATSLCRPSCNLY